MFRFAEDSRKYETVQTNAHLNAEHNHVDMNNELSADIELERQHEMMATATKPIRLTQKDRIRAKLLAKMNQRYAKNCDVGVKMCEGLMFKIDTGVDTMTVGSDGAAIPSS